MSVKPTEIESDGMSRALNGSGDASVRKVQFMEQGNELRLDSCSRERELF